jgi:hypothetical protein
MALRPFQFAAGVHRDGFKAEVRCLAPERVLPPTRLRRRGSPRFEPLDISLTPRCYCPPASKAEGGIPDRLWPSLVEAGPSPDLHRAGWRAWTRVPRCVVRHPGRLQLRGEALILTHSSELLKPTACTVTLRLAVTAGRPHFNEVICATGCAGWRLGGLWVPCSVARRTLRPPRPLTVSMRRRRMHRRSLRSNSRTSKASRIPSTMQAVSSASV